MEIIARLSDDGVITLCVPIDELEADLLAGSLESCLSMLRNGEG